MTDVAIETHTTLKPYPAYRDSGIDWVGHVPEHWDSVQLARLADERKVRNIGMQESTVLSLSFGRIVIKANTVGGLSPADYSTYQIVEPGNVILRLTDLQNDQRSLRVGRSEHRGIITSAYVCLKPAALVNSQYLYRTLHDLDIKKMLYGMGAGVRQGLRYKELRKVLLPLPPLDEQRAIAAFLDAMDARITRFIAARKKMIRLLEEKKQAVINQAVTKGLKPSVPMKDSGVDWLGEIPEHWEVSRLKFVTTAIVDCLHATPIYSDSGLHPAIRTADILPGQVLLDQARRVEADVYDVWTSRLKPVEGDILYSREGERYGIAAPVPPHVELCISQRMMVFRCAPSVDERFIMWQLNARHVYAQASNDAIGAAAPHVNAETIKNYTLVLPPSEEQSAIVRLLDSETRRLDSIASRAKREIKLIQEYRTRLISDVVTGKLDVRGVDLGELPEFEEIPEIGEQTDPDDANDGMGGVRNDAIEA